MNKICRTCKNQLSDAGLYMTYGSDVAVKREYECLSCAEKKSNEKSGSVVVDWLINALEHNTTHTKDNSEI